MPVSVSDDGGVPFTRPRRTPTSQPPQGCSLKRLTLVRMLLRRVLGVQVGACLSELGSMA